VAEPTRGTLVATVLVAHPVGAVTTVVAQQVELRTKLNALMERAVEHVAPSHRLILDTGDGAACLLDHPEDALTAATALRAAALRSALSLRVGINLGPVKIIKDANGQPHLLGDGITDARRVMSFAEPNQILVSRPYYEGVTSGAPESKGLFSYGGIHGDKRIREHEVYLVVSDDAAAGPEPLPAVAAAIAPAAAPAIAPASASHIAESIWPAPSARGMLPPPGPPTRDIPTRWTADPVGPIAAEAGPLRFEAALLGQLETALARALGPLARVIVSRAARSATDVEDLCQALAATVPDSKRREFRREVEKLVARPALPPRAAVDAPSPPAPGPRTELPPEIVASVTARLAVYLGPVAKTIVKKVAGQATSPRDLYERLAQQIDDPRARERFIAGAPG
jgi:class 3 adenylate cyclase